MVWYKVIMVKSKALFISLIIVFYLFASCDNDSKRALSPYPVHNGEKSGISIVIQTGHQEGITDVAFSPDGSYIVSGSFDTTIKLWDRKGQLIKTFNRSRGIVSALGFSPDSRRVACGSNNTIEVWTFDGIFIQAFAAHENYISCIEYHPEGHLIISGSWDTTVKVWDTGGKLKQTLKAHTEPVTCIATSPDGNIVCSGSDDRTIRLWNSKGNLIKTIGPLQNQVKAVGFSHDGKYILSGTADGIVQLISIEGTIIHTFNAHSDSVCDVNFIPGSNHIISSAWDSKIKIWDVKGTLIQAIDTHSGYYERIALSPDGKVCASGSNDRSFKLWSLDGGFISKVEDRTADITQCMLSRIGKYIIWADSDSRLYAWDIKGESNEWYLFQELTCARVAFSPRYNYIAAIFRDRQINVWNTDGKLIRTMKGHTTDRIMLRFSSNEEYLILSSVKWGTRFWKLDGGRETQFSNISHLYDVVVISPDGNCFLTSLGNVLKLWTIDGDFIRNFEGHADMVVAACFGADSRFIASGSLDGTVKLWDTGGRLLMTFTGYSHGVGRIERDPAGRHIITREINGAVKLMEITGKQILELDADYNVPSHGTVFCPDGRSILVRNTQGLALFSSEGDCIMSFFDHPYPVTGLGFSADGKYIIAVFSDGIIMVWERQTLRSISLLTFISGQWFVFDDEGRFDCSEGAETYIRFRKGMELYDAGKAWDEYHTDGLLGEYFRVE
jgi:WD40 repeat protein